MNPVKGIVTTPNTYTAYVPQPSGGPMYVSGTLQELQQDVAQHAGYGEIYDWTGKLVQPSTGVETARFSRLHRCSTTAWCSILLPSAPSRRLPAERPPRPPHRLRRSVGTASA